MAAGAALPKVGVLGPGRVGTALAGALSAAGADVVGVTRDLDRLLSAGLLVIAVPDDALPAVAATLPATTGRYVVHTSGRYGVAVLGERTGRIAAHPCMTFAGQPDDASRIAGTTFGVTADDDARAVAEAFVAALGGRLAWLAEDARPLYHAALANAANHLVALVAESADWLRAAGVAAPYDAVAPLVTAAMHGALERGDAALTGPVRRGDAGTLAAHLAALRAAGRSEVSLACYRALSALTVARAEAAGLVDRAAADAMRAMLQPPPVG